MNSATATKKLLSAEEYARLPAPADGSPTEFVKGEVVVMSPPSFIHGWVQGNVYYLLRQHGDRTRSGRVTVESGMLTEEGPATVRGPEVAFWSYTRLPLDHTPVVFANIAPDLAVEVVSPSNSRKDIAKKVREYFAAGGPMVWVVDPDERTVTVYRKPGDGKVLWDDANLTGDDVLPGFACAVSEFFPELLPATPSNP
jgi:Uma2 family endonuclease